MPTPPGPYGPYPPVPTGYPPPAYGEPSYPYGDPGYGGGPYDGAVTEVFDHGLLTADPYADAITGPIPVSPSVDVGPRGFAPPAGFGPPPPPFEPPSSGFGPPAQAERDAPLFSRFRRIRSHAKRRRSRGWIAVMLVIVVLGAAAGVWFWPGSPWYHGPAEETVVMEPMPFQSTEITVEALGTQGFLSWAYQDLRDGTVAGSANMAETTQTGPMIVAWFGADLLRRAAENGQEPADAELADIEAMILEDDLGAAERVVAGLAGTEDSIGRLGTMCHLNDLTPVAGSWQDTAISAQDAARMGGCLADGRAAGAQWTPWLLNVMRQVHSDFGIREAFPDAERTMIAAANGVVLDEEDGHWRANCLAVSQTWSLAVLQRYPASDDPASDIAHVDAICRQVVFRLTGGQ
jgi:hypothetical protein